MINVCSRLVHPCGAVGKNKTPCTEHTTTTTTTMPNGITRSHLAKFNYCNVANCDAKIRRIDIVQVTQYLSEFDLLAGVAKILGIVPGATLELLANDIDTCFIKALQTMTWDKSTFMHDIRAIYNIMANWMHLHTGICKTWRCFTTITWYLSLYDLSNSWTKHGYIREILRCLAPKVQNAILTRSWLSTIWKDYITECYSYISNSDIDLDGHAIVYAKWNSQANNIYIGKANIVRQGRQPDHYGGAVARFREHWLLTWNPPASRKSEAFRRRYVFWRTKAPESTRWTILLATSSNLAFQYENHFISCTSINLNESERIDGKLVPQCEKQKPWPRFRPKRTVESELSTNYRRNFKKTIKSKIASILAVHSYSQLLDIIRLKHNLPKDAFTNLIYKPGFEWLLIMHLAQPQVWVNWKLMWLHRTESKEHVAILWNIAKRMPTHAKRKIHDRLRRYLLNTDLLPSRITHITVPCNDPKNFNQAKIMTRKYVHECCKSDAVRAYLLAHIQLHKGRGENISDIQGQRQAAHATSSDLVDHKNEFDSFAQRKDVHLIDLHWDRHIIDSAENIVDSITLDLETIRARFYFCRVHLGKWRGNATKRLPKANSRKPSIVPDLSNYPDTTFVPLDKDTKRMCLMSTAGLQQRLACMYNSKPDYYTFETHMKPEDVVQLQKKNIETFVPERYRKNMFIDETKLARAYPLYKGKCLQFDEPCFFCQKGHAHERDIIANHKHACKQFMQKTARGARIAKLLSNDYSWTLPNLSKVAQVTRERFSKLTIVEKYKKLCPCGRCKNNTLTIIRMDASSFFSNAHMQRGINHLHLLLQRIEKKTSCNAVQIDPGKKCNGKFVRIKGPSHETNTLTFKEIKSAFQLAAKECHFLIGDMVVKRHHGWPMGGSHSEPGTMIDVGQFVHMLYADKKTQAYSKLLVDRFEIDEILQGVQHVDDILLMSHIWCHTCIEDKIKAYFPNDMGFETEETGPKLRFLTTWISVKGCQLLIEPYQPNFEFVLKAGKHKKVSRCPMFIDRQCTPTTMLRSFIFAHIFCYSKLCREEPLLMLKHIGILVKEAHMCDWSYTDIATILLSHNLRYRNICLDFCAHIGLHLMTKQNCKWKMNLTHTHTSDFFDNEIFDVV